jgi:hypothetical protein
MVKVVLIGRPSRRGGGMVDVAAFEFAQFDEAACKVYLSDYLRVQICDTWRALVIISISVWGRLLPTLPGILPLF